MTATSALRRMASSKNSLASGFRSGSTDHSVSAGTTASKPPSWWRRDVITASFLPQFLMSIFLSFPFT